jgi:hypothetical protein
MPTQRIKLLSLRILLIYRHSVQNINSMRNLDLDLKTIIGWIGAIIVVTGTASYTIACHVYQERLALRDDKIEELKIQNTTSAEKANRFEIFISPEIKEKVSPAIREEFEKSKEIQQKIIREIVTLDKDAFDPKSEISELAKLLKSNDIKDRKKAVTGFHDIREPSTSLFLSDYFFSHQKEATEGYMPSIVEWIRLFFDFSKSEGITFCINLIRHEDEFQSRIAYGELVAVVQSGHDMSPYTTELSSMALNSNDALRRTWSKFILKSISEIKKTPQNKSDSLSIKSDSRSMFRTILDIEEYLKKNLPDIETGKDSN